MAPVAVAVPVALAGIEGADDQVDARCYNYTSVVSEAAAVNAAMKAWAAALGGIGATGNSRGGKGA